MDSRNGLIWICLILIGTVFVSTLSHAKDIHLLIKEKGTNVDPRTMIISDEDFLEVEKIIKDSFAADTKSMSLKRGNYLASVLVVNYLNVRYKTNTSSFAQDITNEDHKDLYVLALRIQDKYQTKELDACFPDFKNKLKAEKKIKELKNDLKKFDKKEYREQRIKVWEDIHAVCKYGLNSYYLLDEYYLNKKVNKFNKLALEVFRDDQVSYDYLYNGGLAADRKFVELYLRFLTKMNGLHGSKNLSKKEVLDTYKFLMTKHIAVFDIEHLELDHPDSYYIVLPTVGALLNLSQWLNDYGYENERNALIEKFFNQEKIKSSLTKFSWSHWSADYEKVIEDVLKSLVVH